MRTLVYDYSSSMSTEPSYIVNCIKSAGGEAELWTNRAISAYDMFDSYKPDVFICHFTNISQDIAKYLNAHKNVSLVLNVTGASQEAIRVLEENITNNGISCKFMFTNVPYEVTPIIGNKIKVTNILPGLDVFQKKQESVLFNIGTAVVSTQPLEAMDAVTEGLDTYHLLSLSNNEDYDISVDIGALISIYDKYERFILADALPIVTSQVFFETAYRAKFIKVELNKSDRDKFERFLKRIFSGQDSVQDIGNVVKEQIAQNHHCYKRVARLVKQMGDEELAKTLSEVKAQL
jgi:hypothetical protein